MQRTLPIIMLYHSYSWFSMFAIRISNLLVSLSRPLKSAYTQKIKNLTIILNIKLVYKANWHSFKARYILKTQRQMRKSSQPLKSKAFNKNMVWNKMKVLKVILGQCHQIPWTIPTSQWTLLAQRSKKISWKDRSWAFFPEVSLTKCKNRSKNEQLLKIWANEMQGIRMKGIKKSLKTAQSGNSSLMTKVNTTILIRSLETLILINKLCMITLQQVIKWIYLLITTWRRFKRVCLKKRMQSGSLGLII